MPLPERKQGMIIPATFLVLGIGMNGEQHWISSVNCHDDEAGSHLLIVQ
jgi:hypothetical protein